MAASGNTDADVTLAAKIAAGLVSEQVQSHSRRLDTHSTRLNDLEKASTAMKVWKAGYEAHASATEREIRQTLLDMKQSMDAMLHELTEIRVKGAGQTAKVNVWIAGAGAVASAALAWMLGHMK